MDATLCARPLVFPTSSHRGEKKREMNGKLLILVLMVGVISMVRADVISDLSKWFEDTYTTDSTTGKIWIASTAAGIAGIVGLTLTIIILVIVVVVCAFCCCFCLAACGCICIIICIVLCGSSCVGALSSLFCCCRGGDDGEAYEAYEMKGKDSPKDAGSKSVRGKEGKVAVSPPSDSEDYDYDDSEIVEIANDVDEAPVASKAKASRKVVANSRSYSGLLDGLDDIQGAAVALPSSESLDDEELAFSEEDAPIDGDFGPSPTPEELGVSLPSWDSGFPSTPEEQAAYKEYMVAKYEAEAKFNAKLLQYRKDLGYA